MRGLEVRCRLGGIALILPSVLLAAPASISVCCCVLSRANKTRTRLLPPSPYCVAFYRCPVPAMNPPPSPPPSPSITWKTFKERCALCDDAGKCHLCRHHSHRHRLHMFCFSFLCCSLLFVSTFQKVFVLMLDLSHPLFSPLPLPLHKPP